MNTAISPNVDEELTECLSAVLPGARIEAMALPLSPGQRVLIADSRIKDFDMPPYRRIAQREASTLPDLDESPEFRPVSIYLAGDGFSA